MHDQPELPHVTHLLTSTEYLLTYAAQFRCSFADFRRQSDIANERNFAQALSGVELEDLRPNTTQIEPRLQLPW